MKISTFASVALGFLSVTVQAAKPSTKETASKAQIVIQGVLHDFSDQDLAIIGESAMAAYNEFSKETAFTLNSLEPSLHFGVGANAEWPCMFCPPDDDSFALGSEKVLLADIKIKSEWPCMFCPPDDDTVALSTSDNHEAFVNSFCNRLAHSGSANLANAHHCSFSFVEDPGHKVAPLDVTRNADKTPQGYLSVTGLLHDLSKEDLAIIEKSAEETYNEAWKKAGFSVKSVHAKGAIETPQKSEGVKQCVNCPSGENKVAWPCMFCPPDDDTMEYVGSVVLLDVEVGSKWPCMFCPPDDDTVELEAAELKYVNTAFSKALCSKLRMSGSPNLAKADDCAMNFFVEHSLA